MHSFTGEEDFGDSQNVFKVHIPDLILVLFLDTYLQVAVSEVLSDWSQRGVWPLLLQRLPRLFTCIAIKRWESCQHYANIILHWAPGGDFHRWQRWAGKSLLENDQGAAKQLLHRAEILGKTSLNSEKSSWISCHIADDSGTRQCLKLSWLGQRS